MIIRNITAKRCGVIIASNIYSLNGNKDITFLMVYITTLHWIQKGKVTDSADFETYFQSFSIRHAPYKYHNDLDKTYVHLNVT